MPSTRFLAAIFVFCASTMAGLAAVMFLLLAAIGKYLSDASTILKTGIFLAFGSSAFIFLVRPFARRKHVA